MKSITIIHPSRSRPEMAFKTAEKWLNNAYNIDNIQYLMCLDSSDPSLNYYMTIQTDIDWTGWVNDNKSAIEAINFGTTKATGDLLIVVSDDFSCEPHWDTLLIEALQDKSDFIVKTKDGIQKTLITLPIMDRVYYNRFGYVYHHSYSHMHSDEEMTCVAHMLGKVIDLDISFPHNHYSVGGMVKDAINIKNDLTWEQGLNNLNARKKINFGLKPEEIVKPYESIVWH